MAIKNIGLGKDMDNSDRWGLYLEGLRAYKDCRQAGTGHSWVGSMSILWEEGNNSESHGGWNPQVEVALGGTCFIFLSQSNPGCGDNSRIGSIWYSRSMTASACRDHSISQKFKISHIDSKSEIHCSRVCE
jgi:hypothetical protein